MDDFDNLVDVFYLLLVWAGRFSLVRNAIRWGTGRPRGIEHVEAILQHAKARKGTTFRTTDWDSFLCVIFDYICSRLPEEAEKFKAVVNMDIMVASEAAKVFMAQLLELLNHNCDPSKYITIGSFVRAIDRRHFYEFPFDTWNLYSKSVYGNELMYIKDEVIAKQVQVLTGRKTITIEQKQALETLGFSLIKVLR